MDKILFDLKENLSHKRYTHTIGVAKAAIELSDLMGVSRVKSEIAALLHDYAKGMKNTDMVEYARINGIIFDSIEIQNKELMHGKIARHIANNKFNIKDEDILDAIEFHTTGRDKMSKLEILICLADYIEENRNYPGVQEIRDLAKKNHIIALYKAFGNTINYLILDNKIVHPRTIEARNYLLSIINEKGVSI